ncbi:50S ribosomal protein L21 [Candidatus Nitronereus thalassa]|uniref:Large ribosomal subunit protein bL21 n=1 Tax=Candidatus Nitronereus thalassa TaxID=3020898 RepID=A0ABU3KAP1_9BACT|nr:50S ribosomal protein L21 [Candidatus Nitronereus thalassa]MDT7043491.1 50S ribosomal protein L21 [Candidatus Nitronereus thalassa]
MYAILETGGKQYRVEPGSTLQVENLDAEEGQTVELKPVRFISGDNGGTLGQPEVDQAHVKATVVRNGRTRSITVFKKKRRKGFKRTKGHRQGFTQIRIDEIVAS